MVLARVQTQLAVKKGRDALARAHQRMKRDLDAAARIQQTLQGSFDLELDASITHLLDDVWEWTGGPGPNDDVTVLAIQIED